jgi:hypothetical protein
MLKTNVMKRKLNNSGMKRKIVYKAGMLLLALTFILAPQALMGQGFTQTIKGRVIDNQTQMPLPGANVVIMYTEPQIGTITDSEGYFRIDNVVTGRVSIQVSFIGYHPLTFSNLNLSTGKELVLDIEMEEKVIKTEENCNKSK